MTERLLKIDPTVFIHQLVGAGIAVGIAPTHRIIQETINKAGGVEYNSLGGRLLYNSGDFPDGYLACFVSDMALRVVGVKSLGWRTRINLAVGSAVVLLAETMGTPQNFLGRTDIEDVPAGLLGVACYLGITLWANRKQNRGKTQQIPPAT